LLSGITIRKPQRILVGPPAFGGPRAPVRSAIDAGRRLCHASDMENGRGPVRVEAVLVAALILLTLCLLW